MIRAEFDKNKNVDMETAERLLAEAEKKVAASRHPVPYQCKS